nr:23S rRNA (adenine(2503)-C(2))-methyltransferase RlmN [Desulfovibrio sp.]
RQLIKLVRSVRKSKINLIVYNPSAGSPYQAPSEDRILQFEKILWDAGITAVIRKSKGQDIDAACGQLKVSAEAEETKERTTDVSAHGGGMPIA